MFLISRNMIVYNFLVLATVICCKTYAKPFGNTPVKIPSTTKNNNFVEVIRKDLTHNNDDYKEITQENKSINENRVDIFSSNFKLQAKNIKKKVFRRKNGKSYEEYDYDDTTKFFTESRFVFKSNTNKSHVSIKNKIQKINIPKNQSRIDNHNKITLPTTKTVSFTPSLKDLRLKKHQNVIPKFVKKDKIQKFKQFMKKNEGLLEDFVSSKLETQTQQTRLRQLSSNKDNLELLRPIVKDDGIKNIQRTEVKNDGQLPNPDLLDMAPAKGGRIHRQRIKGRLCHRHVLMPEGPKYDSRGRWYVPAHELVNTRPYPETKRPKLLLPRCCNCCKKSVLGCE